MNVAENGRNVALVQGGKGNRTMFCLFYQRSVLRGSLLSLSFIRGPRQPVWQYQFLHLASPLLCGCLPVRFSISVIYIGEGPQM